MTFKWFQPSLPEAPTSLDPVLQASIVLYTWCWETTNGNLPAFIDWFKPGPVVHEPHKEELA